MRIGIDGRILQESHRTGVPDYVYQITTHMVRNNPHVEFVIFCNSFRNIKASLPPLPTNATYRIYRFPNKILEILWPLFPFPKIDRLLGVDIFFSPHIYYLPLSKKSRKMITVHDLSFIRDKRYFNWRKNIWHFCMRPERSIKRADTIIAVSQATSLELQRYLNIPADKITVVPNGYDPKRQTTEADNNSPDPYFFFLSTIEPRKNLSSIAHALAVVNTKRGRNIPLIAGGKKGWLKKNELRAIQKQQDLQLAGYLSDTEISQHYRDCLAFVCTPWHEGFGLAILDAMVAHKPIITSAAASIPELVSDMAIQVNPHYIHDTAAAMNQVAHSDILRDILTTKTHSLQHSSWHMSAQRTFEVIAG